MLNLPPIDQPDSGDRAWTKDVILRIPHDQQQRFIDSTAKRKVIRAGRRGGKTVGMAIEGLNRFIAGDRVLYAAPTEDQVSTFWFEIKRALDPLCDRGILYKNETSHIIEVAGTKNRIRAKTAWNADTLRGDYADYLILDEYQLMNEDAWGVVGAPMLLDNDGDAVFIYTPLSLHNRIRSKARNPRHTAELFKRAETDNSGRWAAFHFTSHDNPFISEAALDEITGDMTSLAYEQEIMAEDKDDTPGALWTYDLLELTRVAEAPPLIRVVIGVDPPGGFTECGIVVGGLGKDGHGYILEDASLKASPETWAQQIVEVYNRYGADRILGEKNFGGDMVKSTILGADPEKRLSYKDVTASRGKAVRAEPIAAQYERERCHHVGKFVRLEGEMTNWIPNAGMLSPNRMDALVWTLTELMLGGRQRSDIWS